MSYKFITFLTMASCLFITDCPAKEIVPPQEIRVQLLVEGNLSPIYLSQIGALDQSLPSPYLKEMEKVLTHDFSYNGKTTVLAKSPTKDEFLKKEQVQELGSRYAVSFSIKNKCLQTKAYDITKASVKTFPDLLLSGNLNEDRQKLHKLSDAIHKAFFHCEGIASSKILYSYQSKDVGDQWISEIAECDADGENIRLLTQEKSYCITPVSIPKDHTFGKDLFLYVSYKLGQPKIFIASKEDGKGKKVVDIRGNQILPAISRKRDKLAFICDASGRTDLFIQSIKPETGQTGAPIQLFSYPRSTQASPTFSPDGSKIAFVSDKDGATRIYCIPTETQGKRPTAEMLTKKNRESSCPSWSYDGTKLAYSAKTEGVRQIWIYDFASKEERQLTFGPGDKENPCFADNSLHIVFNSTNGTNSDLYIVNLNQPESVKITKGSGKKHYPVWSSK